MAKMYQGKKRHRVQRAHGKTQRDMARNLDELAIYDEMFNTILPELRRDLKNRLSSEELLKKYAPLATARQINMIATSENESSVLGAIKDLQDRVMGKAKETQEVTHKLDKLPPEQFDSVLASELLEAGLLPDDEGDDEA